MNIEITIILVLIILGLLEVTIRIIRRSSNVIKGKIILHPGQQTKPEGIKISVFRLGSRKEPELIDVDEKLIFKIVLKTDGQYDVCGMDVHDDGYYTNTFRVIVENGRIVEERNFFLSFRYEENS